MLQSAIVHRQLFYTWSGLSTNENLRTPQTVVPDAISMGYSGKFLEAFIADPTTFPNPTIVARDQINEAETSRIAWSHSGHALLPKSLSAAAETSFFGKGEVVIYRVIRGTAEFKDSAGKTFELATGDTVTAGRASVSLVGMGENTQVLRRGLLKGMDNLRGWTPTQRDEIDGLAGQIITRKDVRPLRTEGMPVGYLYE